ncbi:hypothetical protein [Hoeflea sp.]|uniref:hypothetical protein n=1 Tax=Hoeflea sp. TaxID=1940281 RepID=UPI00198D5DD7|nr:hypothetical protein [Hoeflea sp.]MBC7285476.1 hypothetical protein [Hoeflea sp.]
MFKKWRRARQIAEEAQLLVVIGKLWARGDFESRWIAWSMLLQEVAAEFGSGPVGDIQRFAAGSAIAKTLGSLGYSDSAMSLSNCLIRGNFAWELNSDDEHDPEDLREMSLEEVLGQRAGPYRTAFHRFQRSIT